MIKTLLPLLFSFLICHLSFAQINFGPRLSAMGNNGAAVKDVWSLSSNGAGISGIETPTLAINYTKYFFANELSQQAATFVLPYKKNYAGISFQRYGISEYNEIKAGLALAKKFGDKLAISVKGNYHQLKITNYGTSGTFSIDVGAMYDFNEQFTFGLYVNNPSLQKYNSENLSTKIPTTINIGAAYKTTNKLVIATSVIKDIDAAIDVAVGIDYKFLDVLSFRGGITAKPFKQYVGIGLNYNKFMLDLALESNPQLGYSSQIALCYAF
jgi:hypothetical protein